MGLRTPKKHVFVSQCWTNAHLHVSLFFALSLTRALSEIPETTSIAEVDRNPQDATVRLAAVTALLQLYSEEANITQLHEITIRFKTRFTELPNDIDEDVALKGVSIVR